MVSAPGRRIAGILYRRLPVSGGVKGLWRDADRAPANAAVWRERVTLW